MLFVTIERRKGDMSHFATAVAPAGNVTAWSLDPAQAVSVKEELALKARAYYETRPEAGVILFRDTATGRFSDELPGAPMDACEAIPLTDLTAERDEFRAQAVRLGDRVDELEEERLELMVANDKLRAELKQQTEYADAAVAVDEARRKEIADLKAKVAELEAIIR